MIRRSVSASDFATARTMKSIGCRWWPSCKPIGSLKVRTKDGKIALRHNGKPWESAEQLQKQSSNFLKRLERKGLVGPGLTEHGLRATFAAARKREEGANDSQVAAALGDRDTRMGAHYTRHVENEIKVIQAFGKKPPRIKM
jgi:integrase